MERFQTNEARTMNTLGSSFKPLVLSLVVALAGGLVWGGTSALAVPAIAKTTRVIQIAGTVDGPPESVFFSGNVQIKTNVVPDPDFNGPPAVVISINFLNVTGVGASTKTTYVALGENQYIRRLVASDQLDITFPILPKGGDILSARSASASLSLTFDVNGGQLTAASGIIATPAFAPNL